MTTVSLRKILCALLAAMMLMSVTAAATGEQVTTADGETFNYTVGATSNYVIDYGKYSDVDWSTKPTFKIGFAWMSSSDLLWAMYERAVRYACDVLHCELVFVEWDTSSTTYIADATENLIQAGVDGIISGLIDGASVDACIKAGVPFVGCLNQMNDEMLKTATASGVFCGNVIDDDYVSCYNSVEALYQAGCRNIAWIAAAPGTTQAEIRSKGIMDAIAAHDDLKEVANYRYSGTNRDAAFEALEQIIAANPELDGVALANGLDVTNVMYNNDPDHYIKLGITDLCQSYVDLFKDEALIYCATDQFPTEVIAFTLLYNKLTGHEILSDPSQQMVRYFLELHNYDEMVTMWNASLLNVFPYTAEQILDLCVEFNPAANEDLYTQYKNDYTIENVTKTNQKYLDSIPYEGRLK